MAITVTSPATKVGFIKNGVSADASGCEELVAAVSGKTIKVRQLLLSNNSVGTIPFTIGEGESVPGTPDAVLLGPISLLSGQNLPLNFNPAMELTASKSLVIKADAGAVCVMAQGEIE